MFCDNAEGQDGVGDGKNVQEGEDICTLKAESHSCMAEANTRL